MPNFHRQHYNAIAKDIREELRACLEDYLGDPLPTAKVSFTIEMRIMTKLALRLAKRFQEDNPKVEGDDVYYFRPEKFLDACSPDPDLYPLSELWEEYNE